MASENTPAKKEKRPRPSPKQGGKHPRELVLSSSQAEPGQHRCSCDRQSSVPGTTPAYSVSFPAGNGTCTPGFNCAPFQLPFFPSGSWPFYGNGTCIPGFNCAPPPFPAFSSGSWPLQGNGTCTPGFNCASPATPFAVPASWPLAGNGTCTPGFNCVPIASSAYPAPATDNGTCNCHASPGAGTSSGLGCLPDAPDGRDRAYESLKGVFREVWNKETLQKKLFPDKANAAHLPLPQRIHLGDENEHLHPVRQQGIWNTCTSHVVATLLQYLYRSAEILANDVSVLFLYKTTRRMIRTSGDTGATLRATLKAAAKLGSPPEEHWPYQPEHLLEANPDAIICQLASHQRLHSYYRVNDSTTNGKELVLRIQQLLNLRLPVTCAMPVHRSIGKCGKENGYVIPVPGNNTSVNDPVLGGHAVLIVGYDNAVKADGQKAGAFIIQNSWGAEWGDGGFAFLPYRYVEEGLATDIWVGVIRKPPQR